MNTETKLIPISYFDPKAEVRLSVYADTLVLEPELTEKTLRAIRFGGYPEMVRAMSDAIYGGAGIDAEIGGTSIRILSQVKRYQRQLSHDGVYAEATLLSLDDDQSADEADPDAEGQERRRQGDGSFVLP